MRARGCFWVVKGGLAARRIPFWRNKWQPCLPLLGVLLCYAQFAAKTVDCAGGGRLLRIFLRGAALRCLPRTAGPSLADRPRDGRRGGGCRTWRVLPTRDRDAACGLAPVLASAPPQGSALLLRLLHGGCRGWPGRHRRPSSYQDALRPWPCRTFRHQPLLQRPSSTSFQCAFATSCARDRAAIRRALHRAARRRRAALCTDEATRAVRRGPPHRATAPDCRLVW